MLRNLQTNMTKGRAAAVGAVLPVLLTAVCACSVDPLGGLDRVEEGKVVFGEEIVCSNPVEGFARFTEVGQQVGLDFDVPPSPEDSECSIVSGGVVAEDLDGDGDVDLMFHNPEGFPLLFANDGKGVFSEVEGPGPTSVREVYQRSVMGHSAVDLNGDGLSEVVVVGPSMALMSENLGELQFGPWTVVFDQPSYPRVCINSSAWGDVDGDGDLDVLLPGLCEVPGPGPSEESVPDVGNFDLLLLQNDDGGFDLVEELAPAGTPGLSILAAFTDREGDGDLDLFVGSDRAGYEDFPPSAFYRNDGLGESAAGTAEVQLFNDAPEVGADLAMSAMGFVASDLNRDGRLDYCFSDVAPSLTCLQTFGESYVESGAALGLIPRVAEMPGGESVDEGWVWSTWSIEAADLDADGYRDMVAVAGIPPEFGEVEESLVWQPDAIFQGTPDGGFEDRSSEVGFLNPSTHFGLAVADLAGDGFLDLVVGPEEGRPFLWDNPCGSAHWLGVELTGAGKNRLGFGTRVEVTWDGRTEIAEVHGVRAVGQSPARLYFGMGDTPRADRLRVVFPDGVEVVVEDVPLRRVVSVIHPEATTELD